MFFLSTQNAITNYYEMVADHRMKWGRLAASQGEYFLASSVEALSFCYNLPI